MKFYVLLTKSETGVPVKAQAVTDAHAEVIALTRYQEIVPLEGSWSARVVYNATADELAEANR